MVPSLPLLSCELSVSAKENPDRKKKFEVPRSSAHYQGYFPFYKLQWLTDEYFYVKCYRDNDT